MDDRQFDNELAQASPGFIEHGDYREADAGLWKRWPHFTPAEMRCRGSGKLLVAVALLANLEKLRDAVGFPLPVSSGYRSPAHNALVSATGADGPHTTGLAVDIAVYGAYAHAVVGKAIEIGFGGIGVYQTGPLKKRHIHIDIIPSGGRHPRPTIWSNQGKTEHPGTYYLNV